MKDIDRIIRVFQGHNVEEKRALIREYRTDPSELFGNATMIKFLLENGKRMRAKFPGWSNIPGDSRRRINEGDEIYYLKALWPRYDDMTGELLNKKHWTIDTVVLLVSHVEDWLAAD